VKATFPFYVIRLCGGLLYLSGMVIMAWNVLMTVRSGKPAAAVIPAVAPAHA
jgi:cytochrome c oxidase cbb3-type subunit 1